MDFNEKRGLLWILEEESSYSGSNDLTFLEKLQAVHGEPDDFGKSDCSTIYSMGMEFLRYGYVTNMDV